MDAKGLTAEQVTNLRKQIEQWSRAAARAARSPTAHRSRVDYAEGQRDAFQLALTSLSEAAKPAPVEESPETPFEFAERTGNKIDPPEPR